MTKITLLTNENGIINDSNISEHLQQISVSASCFAQHQNHCQYRSNKQKSQNKFKTKTTYSDFYSFYHTLCFIQFISTVIVNYIIYHQCSTSPPVGGDCHPLRAHKKQCHPLEREKSAA